MLVRGVWRLWLTPRRKSSLAASSSSSCWFWASTRANSWALRIADRHLAREQLEQVLVGRLPAAGRGQPTDEHAEVLAARRAARRGAGARSPGTTLLLGDGRGSPMTTVASMSANAVASRRARSRSDERLDVVAGRDLVDRGEDPAELPVAPLEVGRQAVVAVGEAGELVVAGDLDRASSGRRRRPGPPPTRPIAAAQSARSRARTRRGSRRPATIDQRANRRIRANVGSASPASTER